MLEARSMEFTSAKTYARVENNLSKAEEWGLKALEKEPENSFIAFFLAKEVFLPQKKQNKCTMLHQMISRIQVISGLP